MNHEPLTMNHLQASGIQLYLTLVTLGTLVHFIFLYTCRDASTNQLFLCKTNPISKKVKPNQTQFQNGKKGS